MHGPFFIWLHSAELLSRGQKLGLYARYQSSLPQRLSELCILMMAAHWKAAGEWVDHAPIARELGVDAEALEALRKGLPAKFKNADEAAAYELAQELLNKRDVSDATYARVKAVLGERGILDLIAVLGYYGLIAMSMKTFALSRTAPPIRSQSRHSRTPGLRPEEDCVTAQRRKMSLAVLVDHPTGNHPASGCIPTPTLPARPTSIISAPLPSWRSAASSTCTSSPTPPRRARTTCTRGAGFRCT